MRVIPFKAEHFWALDVQDAQKVEKLYTKPEYLDALQYRYSFTIMADDGEPMACIGCIDIYPGRGAVWAYISRHAGQNFSAVHKLTRKLMDGLPHERIETEVAFDFEQGHRWMRLLGFTPDAPRLRRARPDGSDATLYSRVR